MTLRYATYFLKTNRGKEKRGQGKLFAMGRIFLVANKFV